MPDVVDSRSNRSELVHAPSPKPFHSNRWSRWWIDKLTFNLVYETRSWSTLFPPKPKLYSNHRSPQNESKRSIHAGGDMDTRHKELPISVYGTRVTDFIPRSVRNSFRVSSFPARVLLLSVLFSLSRFLFLFKFLAFFPRSKIISSFVWGKIASKTDSLLLFLPRCNQSSSLSTA